MKESFEILKEVMVMVPVIIKSDYESVKKIIGIKDTNVKNTNIRRSTI